MRNCDFFVRKLLDYFSSYKSAVIFLSSKMPNMSLWSMRTYINRKKHHKERDNLCRLLYIIKKTAIVLIKSESKNFFCACALL